MIFTSQLGDLIGLHWRKNIIDEKPLYINHKDDNYLWIGELTYILAWTLSSSSNSRERNI